jgi:outer membrane protein OmpA-like peptidoglycan-associated protein
MLAIRGWDVAMRYLWWYIHFEKMRRIYTIRNYREGGSVGRSKKILLLAALLLISIVSSSQVFALTKGFEAMSLRPVTDGGPYIGIWGSENMKQLEWEAGTLAVYAYRPLQLTQNGNRVRGILDNTLVQHFYGQFGIVDQWLSMGFDIPIGWWAQFRDPNVAAAVNQNKLVFGDIYVNFKSELVTSKHFGFAIRPFLTIPTGYGREFFGNGGVTGGGTLIGEFKPLDIWAISLNAGVQARSKFNFRDIEKSNQLELGLGTAIQVTKPVSIVFEVASATRLSGPFSEKVESPTEARGAVKWAIGESGFLANLGGTAGIVRGSVAPTYSVFAGFSFSPRRRRYVQKPKKFDFSDYTVYFDTGSYEIKNSENAGKVCDLSDKIRDKKINIAVEGYTDSTGVERANEVLSEKRADKVAWFLSLLGIESSRVTTVGKGSADPAESNATRDGRTANRRVEFDNSIK